MRNSPLKGLLNIASPTKQKLKEVNPGDYYNPIGGKAPKPQKKEVKKTPPPKPPKLNP
tara:strand:+ start:1427 stop:1600 length:174 start_codon:yes stop_codon:yes gene_type:complete